MDELPLKKVLVQMNDPDDHETIDELVYYLALAIDDDDVNVAS